MSSHLYIGPAADTVIANRVNLDDGVNFRFTAVSGQFNNQQLVGAIGWGEYVRDAVQRGNQPPAPVRELVLPLRVSGASETACAVLYHTLQKVLQQARDSSKLGALGPGVVLVWQPDAGTPGPETYIDVVGGRLDVIERAGEAKAGSWVYAVRLTLAVLPFYRRAAQTIATSATITDTCTTYRIADTGGDADGLLKLTLTDQSISSKIINKVWVGRRSLQPLAAADFTPILTPTAVSPGATVADATARGGSTTQLAGPGFDAAGGWVTFAKAPQPATGLAQGGEVLVMARLRDSSAYLNPIDTATAPTVTESSAAGTLPPDDYLVRIAAVDSAGNESAASYPAAITLSRASGGIYDDFSGGNLSQWDNSGYAQFYRAGTTQVQGAGSVAALPDAAYEGTYGFRATVLTTVAPSGTNTDVYRCVLQKAAQGVTAGNSGTTTVYGRFRINQAIFPDNLAQAFITFFSAAQGNTSGAVAGYLIDYSVNNAATSTGVVAGLRFVGGDTWQFCAPYGGAAAGSTWQPLPGVYVHLTQGQWYNFACSMTATFNISGSYKLTLNACALNGVLISGAQTQTSAATAGFPATGAALTPTIGAALVGVSGALYDLNDSLSVDFDDLGALTGATLGELLPAWSAVAGADHYVLYYAAIEEPTQWGRVVLGNVTSTTLATPVSAAATLPQARLAGTITPATVRALILPPNSAAVGGVPTSGGAVALAQSAWEWTPIGTAALPAIPTPDGGASPPGWTILLQAQLGGPNLPTLACDVAVLLPVDEDLLIWEVPGANLPSLGVHVADLNRLGRQSVAISPVAGGVATAYASVTGRLHAGQGDTTLVILAAVADAHGHYVSDAVNTKFTVGAVVQQRMESV